MPTYEFKCNDCKQTFTAFVFSYSDRSKIKCKFCGSKNISQTYSTCNFILKGSGWYNDGYSSK